MFQKKERFNSNNNVVNFSYSNQEFNAFYENHKILCDEMSGIKLRVVKTLKSQEEVEITAHNFILAIKRLEAFVINYAHNFDDTTKQKEVFALIRELESDFINDSEYEHYASRTEPNTKELAELNVRYFNYLFRCFNLLVKVGNYLQTSMMVSTINIQKLIEWYDTKPFFDNLTNYRGEVSNDLSNFTVGYVVKHYKKVLGYHYTYRFLVDYKELNEIDELIRICNAYILDKKYMEWVFGIREKGIQDETVKSENVFLKKMFSSIYLLTNKSLTNKNVLPKKNKKERFDKTGI